MFDVRFLSENLSLGFNDIDEPVMGAEIEEADYDDIEAINSALRVSSESARKRDLESQEIAATLCVG